MFPVSDDRAADKRYIEGFGRDRGANVHFAKAEGKYSERIVDASLRVIDDDDATEFLSFILVETEYTVVVLWAGDVVRVGQHGAGGVDVVDLVASKLQLGEGGNGNAWVSHTFVDNIWKDHVNAANVDVKVTVNKGIDAICDVKLQQVTDSLLACVYILDELFVNFILCEVHPEGDVT
ncbi:hypothetical protein EYF80_000108 [Liparis tanakae]|uniref:Uncharacterized protein n=1 Tax=Liparis tanakae TaxID=230148 RepID=A0A4Z2JGX5_9TELE|nr:hypothetical protein EYF80_000108 [Liparis tanakae]